MAARNWVGPTWEQAISQAPVIETAPEGYPYNDRCHCWSTGDNIAPEVSTDWAHVSDTGFGGDLSLKFNPSPVTSDNNPIQANLFVPQVDPDEEFRFIVNFAEFTFGHLTVYFMGPGECLQCYFEVLEDQLVRVWGAGNVETVGAALPGEIVEFKVIVTCRAAGHLTVFGREAGGSGVFSQLATTGTMDNRDPLGSYDEGLEDFVQVDDIEQVLFTVEYVGVGVDHPIVYMADWAQASAGTFSDAELFVTDAGHPSADVATASTPSTGVSVSAVIGENPLGGGHTAYGAEDLADVVEMAPDVPTIGTIYGIAAMASAMRDPTTDLVAQIGARLGAVDDYTIVVPSDLAWDTVVSTHATDPNGDAWIGATVNAARGLLGTGTGGAGEVRVRWFAFSMLSEDLTEEAPDGSGGGCGGGPTQVLVLPDGRLQGRANVVSATSQAGPTTPSLTAVEGNYGDAVPTMVGIPTDPTLPDLQLLVHESGNVESHGFVWQSEGDSDYVGMDDGRRLAVAKPPFVEIGGVSEWVQGEASCYHPPTRTIWVAVVDADNTNTIRLRSRLTTENAIVDDWTTQPSLALGTIDGAPHLTPGQAFQRAAMAVGSDGTMFLAYAYVKAFGSLADNWAVAVLGSTDGGTSWRCLHPEAISLLSNTGHHLRLTVSGDWLRIDAMDIVGDLLAVASRDGGLSWSDKVETTAISPFQGGTTNVDPSPFAVAGVGGGRFLLAYTQAADKWRTGQAFGGDVWVQTGTSAVPLTRTAPGTIRGLGSCVHGGRVYVVMSYDDGAGQPDDDQIALYYQSLDRIFAFGPGSGTPLVPLDREWQAVEPLSRWRGARFLPVRISLISTELVLHLFAGLWDTVDDADEVATFACQLSQYTVQSFGLVPPGGKMTATTDLDTLGPFYDVLWHSMVGRPAGSSGAGGSSSPDTDWTETVVGVPTIQWLNNYTEITTSAVQHVYWEIIRPSTDGSWLGVGATVGAICRCTADSSILANRHGLEVFSESDANPGDRVHFVIRVNGAGVVVNDEVAGASVATGNPDPTDWVEIRCRFEENSAGVVTGTLWVARLDDYFAPDVQDFTLTPETVGFTTNTLRWGSLANGAGVSAWREVFVCKGIATDRAAFANPTDLLGVPARTDVQQLLNGLGVRWGGGSGARGDAFVTTAQYTHAVENAFTDSGFMGWRSTSTAEQALIFSAGDGDDDRFMHDEVCLWGLEDYQITVEYDDDPAFGTPTTAEVLDTTLFTGAIVGGSVKGGTCLLEADAPPQRVPVVGEIAGCRLRFTSGALLGQTFVIVRHVRHGAVDLATYDADGSLVPADLSAVLAGDEVLIYSTYGRLELVAFRRFRYMRLTFPLATTATGDHRLGAIVAGPSLEVPIPLEWSHTDAETSDVQLFEGANASWGYELGAPRRLWTARIVNDYVRWRESLRALLRSLARYEQRPVVWVPDSTEHRRIIRGRMGGQSHDQGFWWPTDDGDGTYRFPGGDATISLLEVP